MRKPLEDWTDSMLRAGSQPRAVAWPAYRWHSRTSCATCHWAALGEPLHPSQSRFVALSRGSAEQQSAASVCSSSSYSLSLPWGIRSPSLAWGALPLGLALRSAHVLGYSHPQYPPGWSICLPLPTAPHESSDVSKPDLSRGPHAHLSACASSSRLVHVTSSGNGGRYQH